MFFQLEAILCEKRVSFSYKTPMFWAVARNCQESAQEVRGTAEIYLHVINPALSAVPPGPKGKIISVEPIDVLHALQ